MKNKVCVYAICKNEEENIERWIKSIEDADLKVILIDASSTDSTKEKLLNIAESDSTLYVYHGLNNMCVYKNGFGYMRNYVLNCARNIIDSIRDDQDEWIFLSLDFDEFIFPNGINNIKGQWKPEFDTMEIKGVTSENDYQYISHKIHSSNNNWHWIRTVHEILSLSSEDKKVKQTEWKVLKPDESMGIGYLHVQNSNKNRIYYELLMKDYNEHPNDIKTTLYLAWESYNHNEFEQFFELSKRTIQLVCENEDDEFYQNPEYALQANINISEYAIDKLETPDFSLALNAMNEAEKIIDNKLFPPFRRLYSLIGLLYQKMIITEKNDTLNFYHMCIEYFKKALSVKVRPYCWVDDDNFYNNGLIYYNMSLAGSYVVESGNSDISCYEDSVFYAKLALDIDPTNEEYKHQMDMCCDRLENRKEKSTSNNKICVYAITKNESKFVDKWYESMKEADSIVVLDTGSTDDTVEKLKSHGVTVKTEIIDPWRFDVPRNKAMEMAPKDCNILVSTDLDEVLEPGWADVLRHNWIDGIHERAIYKYSWSHLANGESGRVFQYDKIHSRNWIWKFPVHELLWNTDTHTNDYEQSTVLNLFEYIHLHHYPDRSKSRGSYLPLLELRAEENEDDYYGLIYLSHEYYYRDYFQKSIDTLNKVLIKHKEKLDTVEEASCYLFMGDDYMELKNYEKSEDSYLKAIRIEPTYREPYLNLAQVLMEQKKYEIAITYIKQAIKESYRHYTWLERDISWTYEPYDLLSIACYYAGYKKDSLMYAVKANSYEPENDRLRNNVKIILDLTDDKELL